MDFQLLAGDSWHANTPRKGHPTRPRRQLPPRDLDLHRLPPDPLHHPVGPGGRQGRLRDRAAVRTPVPDRAPGQQPGAVPRSSRGPLGADDPRAGQRAGPALDDRDGLRKPRRRHVRATICTGASPSSSSSTTTAGPSCRPTSPTATTRSAATRSPPIAGASSTRSTGAPAMPATPATRDLVARLLPTGKPAHTRDLAAQTIGLCLIDPKQREARRA